MTGQPAAALISLRQETGTGLPACRSGRSIRWRLEPGKAVRWTRAINRRSTFRRFKDELNEVFVECPDPSVL